MVRDAIQEAGKKMMRGVGVLTHPSCMYSFLRTIVKGIGGQGRTEVCPGRTIRRWSSADKWPLYLIIYAICMDAPRCVHISFLYLIIYADTCIDDAPGCVPTVCPIRDGKRVAEASRRG